MKYTDPTLLDTLCAQYVLGTLRGRARQRFERLLRERVDVRSLVYAWERRLQDLDDPGAVEPPPPRVWQQLVDRLGFTHEAPPARPARRPWRLSQALAAGIAALALIGGTWFTAQWQAPDNVVVRELAPAYVSIIADGDGNDLWWIQVYEESSQLRVSVTGEPAPLEGRVYELWMLPDGANPVSLGLLPRSGTLRAAVSRTALDALARSTKLAVSTEPPGGSPTGQPTGDVVFIAPLARDGAA